MESKITDKFFIAKVYWEKNDGPVNIVLKATSPDDVKQILYKSSEIKEIYNIEEINQEELEDFR